MEPKYQCENDGCKKMLHAEELSKTFNYCSDCEYRRQRNYDNYVDPLGVYQNKNFDLD